MVTDPLTDLEVVTLGLNCRSHRMTLLLMDNGESNFSQKRSFRCFCALWVTGGTLSLPGNLCVWDVSDGLQEDV